jgi:hypothetical protein
MDTGYITPVDKIFISGHRQSVEMGLEEASMYPGMLVMHGTTNNDVKINTGASIAYGWLSYEDSPLMWRPANIDTAYAISARAGIVHGPGAVLRAILANGDNVVMGDLLVGTSGGELKKWAPIVDTGSGGATEEQVVAQAMDDGTTTSAAVKLIVRSLI